MRRTYASISLKRYKNGIERIQIFSSSVSMTIIIQYFIIAQIKSIVK